MTHRVVIEVGLQPESINDACAKLVETGLVTSDSNKTLAVADLQGTAKDIGANTQVALDKALIDAAKSAKALNISTAEAAAMFKKHLVDADDNDE